MRASRFLNHFTVLGWFFLALFASVLGVWLMALVLHLGGVR